jgi:hypothetical protein
VTTNYKLDLEHAVRDLLKLTAEREQWEVKIAKQKKRVAALYELVQTDEGAAALTGLVEGITDACRVVMRAAEKPLSVSDIRDRVQALGLPPQANLLASIHTTVKRMKESGEVAEHMMALESGGTGAFYVWQGVGTPVNVLAEQVLGAAARTPRPTKWGQKAREALKRDKPAHRAVYGDLSDFPNPFGKTLGEMVNPPKKK